MEQVDGHHTGGDGHVKSGAEHTEHAESRQKAGVDSDEATDPAAERCTDAKQGCDLAALEARAQGERRHHELDGCVNKGRGTGEPGAREPGGKAGILPGVEHRVCRERHERAHECASKVVGDKAAVQVFDGSNRPGKEARGETKDDGADNNDGNRPWRHVGDAGDNIRLVLGTQGE